MGPVIERRKFERVAMHEAVLVELPSGDVRLRTISDLSEGGAFVERLHAAVGARVVVHLRCADADWSAALRTIVRWTSERGAGVELQQLDARGLAAVLGALGRAHRPSHARQRVADDVRAPSVARRRS